MSKVAPPGVQGESSCLCCASTRAQRVMAPPLTLGADEEVHGCCAAYPVSERARGCHFICCATVPASSSDDEGMTCCGCVCCNASSSVVRLAPTSTLRIKHVRVSPAGGVSVGQVRVSPAGDVSVGRVHVTAAGDVHVGR